MTYVKLVGYFYADDLIFYADDLIFYAFLLSGRSVQSITALI